MEKILEKATLAGGCFWCLESVFSAVPGVVETTVGYAGGEEKNPSYEEVCSGLTRHREAIEIVFDSALMSYDEILVRFWTQIDPTDPDGQFVDRSFSYTTAIWYHTDEQKQHARESIARLQNSGVFHEPIATVLLPYTTFFPAEEYHQKYYQKSSFRYELYKKGSLRDDFIETTWTQDAIEYLRGKDAFLAKKYRKPSLEELKDSLPEISYEVTQMSGTEMQYSSPFSVEWQDGIYVDIVSGEPLFSSRDQYDAGCGWPSFTRPISSHFITKASDVHHGIVRTEVRSKYGESHLGHLFDDGPNEAGGLRYCINGAALRFIPREDMEKEGYGEFLEREFLIPK